MISDEQLKKNVEEELTWKPELCGANLSVRVKSGVVMISGWVDGFFRKLAIENAARKVKGVKGFAEEITVKLPSPNRRSDTDIQQAANAALQWNQEVPENRINVFVKNAWLSLEGVVDWQFQKNAAQLAVTNLKGLKGFTNNIQIKPCTANIITVEQIKKALERRSDMEHSRIFIEVSGNRVILKGIAQSWCERNEAEQAAWCAPGVVHVENELVIGSKTYI